MLQFIRKLLNRFLPNKIKRMFCLATLAYVFAKVNSLEGERQLVRRINLELNIAEDEQAIKYAIMYANQIWKHIHFYEEDGTVTYYLRDLYTQLPYWMKYDAESIMTEEISKVAEVVSTSCEHQVCIGW